MSPSSTTRMVRRAILPVLLVTVVAALPALAVDVDFDVFPGPDGKLGTADDVPVVAGDEITDQYMSLGVMIENAVSSTMEPGLFAIPQGAPGSETDDIIPTTPPHAAAPLEIPGDLSTSSTGFVLFTFTPPIIDFSLDFLDVEGSGSPGTENTYVDINLSDGATERILLPSAPNGSQQNVSYTAPAGLDIISLFVSLNDGEPGGESSAIDSLSFTPTGGCWLTSGGWLNAYINNGRKSRHTFGGNVGPPPSGAWEHQDHPQGLNFHSNDAHIVRCYNDGRGGPGNPKADDNVAEFEGTGRLNNEDGYAFEAKVIDRGEPGKNDDYYEIRVWRISDGEEFIDIGKNLSGGNIQIHPPNPSLD